MVTPDAKREVVKFFRTEYEMTERQACRAVKLCRGTARYRKKPDGNGRLRKTLRRLATKHRRYGIRRLYVLLRRQGWKVNHKRVARLYRQEKLILRLKRRKRFLSLCKAPLPKPESPNEVWSMDFVHDSLSDGCSFRCLTIVDDASRFSPAIEVSHSITGARVTRVLERLSFVRGLPKVIRVDNGPEFRGKELAQWSAKRGILLHFISPGRPMENAFIESFNDKFRAECLNDNWFTSIGHAQDAIERWRLEYNRERPHSSLDNRTPWEFEKEYANMKTDRKNQLMTGTN